MGAEDLEVQALYLGRLWAFVKGTTAISGKLFLVLICSSGVIASLNLNDHDVLFPELDDPSWELVTGM